MYDFKKERGSAITIFHPINLLCCSMNGQGTFPVRCKCVRSLVVCLEGTPTHWNWDGVWDLCPSSKTWCCTFHGDNDQAFLACNHLGCAESPRWHLDLDKVLNLEKRIWLDLLLQGSNPFKTPHFKIFFQYSFNTWISIPSSSKVLHFCLLLNICKDIGDRTFREIA